MEVALVNINLKRVDNNCFDKILEYFDEVGFYYKTKRPESLTEGNIRQLLGEKDCDAFSITIDNKKHGIISFEEDPIENNAVIMHLRLTDMNIILENVGEFDNIIHEKVKDYNILKVEVFSFDEKGKSMCELLGFEVEAVMRNHVFKDNKYNDKIIYRKVISGRSGICD